jgi:hypothetical protein
VERSELAAAQGLSEQLQAEGERRARAFRAAVKAGVAKVQAELEAERDSLAARCCSPRTLLLGRARYLQNDYYLSGPQCSQTSW